MSISNAVHKIIGQDGTHLRRPHNVNPVISTVRVVLAVKNFAAIQGVCHIGLGVTATNTIKVLRDNGIHAEAWPAQTAKELLDKLRKAAQSSNYVPITHVIISAPSWVQPSSDFNRDGAPGFKELCLEFPEIEFIQLNHSGAAYLSIDKFGIRNIRECIELSLSLHNLRVAANNTRVVDFLNKLGCGNILYLPNLYDYNSFVTPFTHQKLGDTLRVGSFGASRPWKNQLTSAEGFVMLARTLGVKLEFYINSKRPDGGERMIESRSELFDNLPGCKLIEVPWAPWPKFRKIVGSLHVQTQASFDETFDVVCADGIAEGVPCVTSSALEWTPEYWWSNTPEPASIARVALNLIHNPDAVEDGRRNLKRYVKSGVIRWIDYLVRQPEME